MRRKKPNKENKACSVLRVIACSLFILSFIYSPLYALQDQTAQPVAKDSDSLLAFNEKVNSSERQNISIHAEQEPLLSVLKRIAEKKNVGISYQKDIIPNQEITVHIHNTSIFQALRHILEGTGLKAVMPFSRDVLVIKEKQLLINLKQEVVTGTVTNAKSGEPIPNVNIVVRGTNTGTSTNADGHYSLQVPSLQDTLVFSFIGYESKIVPINGRTNINIQLQPMTVMAEELVVVGFGTQKRGNVTGAISSVDPKNLSNKPVTNLLGGLEGKLAGVRITQQTGQPGASPMVRIRGMTSINSSSPLYVVNGIPLPSANINTINPNSVASIQILKGASATAIYGSRGANGVILIETKKGNAKNSVINVNISGGFQQLPRKIPLANTAQYIMLTNEAYTNAGKPPLIKKPASAFPNTDWQDVVFRLAPMQSYNVSFSGGTERLTYRVGGGYSNQKGIIKYTGYKRYTFQLSSTFDPKSNVEVGTTLNLSKSKRFIAPQTSQCCNIIVSTIRAEPTRPLKNENGKLFPLVPKFTFSNDLPPLAQLKFQTSNEPHKNWKLLGGLHVQYNPIQSLTVKTKLGVNLIFDEVRNFNPIYNAAPNYYNKTRSLSHTKSRTSYWAWNNTVTYETDINANNHIKILGGISAQRFSSGYIMASNTNQPGDAQYLRYLNAGTSTPAVAGQRSQWSMLSYFGRLNYNYKQTYFLTFSFRRDGSSKFGPGNRYGNFPAVSAGWILTNESFFEDNKVIDFLKLRAGWGITGNQSSVGFYNYAASIVNSYYVFGHTGGNLAVTAEPGELSNLNMHWEQVNQWNIGLNYGLLNSSITGSIDYYHKKTKGMLLSLPILATSGFTRGPRTNLASMVNSGLEFKINYFKSLNENLSLNAGLNFATLHNTVTNLQRRGHRIFSGTNKQGNANLTAVGHRVASFYGYVMEGIFQNNQQIKNHAKQPGAEPGDIIFKDVNQDGVINSEDRTFLGTPIPKVTYGFHIGGNYKGFNWNISFNGVYGNKIYNALKWYLDELLVAGYRMGKEALNRWHGPGTSNTIPKLDLKDPNNNTRVSSFWLEDGSYLRIRNITIGYTIPQSLFGANVDKIHVYFTVQNALTFTDYSGYTPEIGQAYGGNAGTLDLGIDYGQYPHPRIFSMGINLKF